MAKNIPDCCYCPVVCSSAQFLKNHACAHFFENKSKWANKQSLISHLTDKSNECALHWVTLKHLCQLYQINIDEKHEESKVDCDEVSNQDDDSHVMPSSELKSVNMSEHNSANLTTLSKNLDSCVKLLQWHDLERLLSVSGEQLHKMCFMEFDNASCRWKNNAHEFAIEQYNLHMKQ